jgi:hypothetical protein
MENVFIKNPLKISILTPRPDDPWSFLSEDIYIVGSAPSSIKRAIKKGDAKILRSFYGNGWKEKIGYDKNTKKKTGNAEFRSEELPGDGIPDLGENIVDMTDTKNEDDELLGDLVISEEDILDADIMAEEDEKKHQKYDFAFIKDTSTMDQITKKNKYPDMAVFPEDNFTDLKEKIQIVTGIDTWRQHIFWVSDGKIKTTYRIIIDEAGIYVVNIDSLKTEKESIAEIPIDKYLYENRNSLLVESNDIFMSLGEEFLDEEFPNIFIIDMENILKNRENIYSNVQSTYSFERFYYGIILKFWPWFSLDVFNEYLRDPNSIRINYPDLAIETSVLSKKYDIQNKIMESKYSPRQKSSKLSTAILRATISMNSPNMLNVRNLLDFLQTSKRVPYIKAFFPGSIVEKTAIGEPEPFVPVTIKSGICLALRIGKLDTKNYMLLNITTDGYSILTTWNEEDNINFVDLIGIAKKYVNPIISNINKLSSKINLYSNLKELDEYLCKYKDISVSLYWKKMMLSSGFKLLKSLWKEYAEAGIVEMKGLQMMGFQLTFKKGMINFNKNSIKQVVMGLTNYYDHLTNSSVKIKWDQHYSGKTMRMTHRTTDIKFDITRVDEGDFNVFFEFIENFIFNSLKIEKIRVYSVSEKKDVKKLKKLQEQDPELYNLKKYGSKKVYSVLCQEPKQPLIHTNEEYEALSDFSKNKLTEYWNFTLNKPVFYGCPNKTYPHMSFIVGKHPKNYCLPCCKKKKLEKESKQKKLYDLCLSQKSAKRRVITEHSTHILSYGKYIEIGRLGYLSGFMGQIFDDLYAYGVEQHLPGHQKIGMAFCVADILGLSIEEFIGDLCKKIKKVSVESFLGGRMSTWFKSVDILIDTLFELFIKKSSIVDIYFKHWNQFFEETATKLYNTNIIYLEAEHLRAPIDVFKGKFSFIMEIDGMFFPIYNIIPKDYFKSFAIKSKTFNKNDKFAQIIAQILGKTKIDLDLNLVQNYGEIIYKFINRHNKCYGVILSVGGATKQNKKTIFSPVKYLVTRNDSKCVHSPFDPKKFDLPRKNTDVFIASLGKQVDINISYILEFKGKFLGYEVLVDDSTYNFYFNEEIISNPKYPVKNLRNNIIEVNKLLMNDAQPDDIGLLDGVMKGFYDNYLYKLFFIEFMNYSNKERNNDKRNKIKKLITTFNKDPSRFSENMSKILPDHPDDIIKINRKMTEFYPFISKMIKHMDTQFYEFDKKTLYKFMILEKSELINNLSSVMSGLIKIGEPKLEGTPANIFFPCETQEGHKSYCDGKKLIMSKRKFGELVEILAGDILNPLKGKYLGFFTENIVDFYQFVNYPNEQIFISKI